MYLLTTPPGLKKIPGDLFRLPPLDTGRDFLYDRGTQERSRDVWTGLTNAITGHPFIPSDV